MNDEANDPLRTLERAATPPPHLKGRVLRSLEQRGLLQVTTWSVARRSGRPIGAVAAGVLLFAAGVAFGRRSMVSAADTRPSFALLLYEGADFHGDRPESALIVEYRAWAESLRARGVLVRGEALDTATQLMRQTPQGVQVQSDGGGRGVSDQGVLTGFFIIHAADEAEAVAVARTCPHLRHGGRIALRRVIPT